MAGATVLSDRLFVVGGSSGLAVYASAEMLDTAGKAWVPIASMGSPRSGLGVAVLSGTMYVLGGYDGSSNLVSVESYDEESQQWLPQPPMQTARRRFSICCQLS